MKWVMQLSPGCLLEKVSVCVGLNSAKPFSVGQRLTIQFSFQKGIQGCTHYYEGVAVPVRLLVLLGGPILSLLIALLSG